MNSVPLVMDVVKANIGVLKRPYKLNLYLTNRCNSKCRTCSIWKKEQSDELTTDELDTFFRKNNWFKWVDITGGEIFLRDDLEQIFESMVKHCQKLHLMHFPTNGTQTERIVSIVKKLRTDFRGKIVVSVSIDGPEELHDRLRGKSGTWKKAVNTFRQLHKTIPGNVFIGYTMSNHNLNQFENTYKALRREFNISVSGIHVNIAQHSDIYYSNEHEILDRDVLSGLKQYSKMRRLRLSPFFLLESLFIRRLIGFANNERQKCHAGISTISINPSGQVYTCLFKDERLGSLRDIDYDLSKIRTKKENSCSKCYTACEAYPTILSRVLR